VATARRNYSFNDYKSRVLRYEKVLAFDNETWSLAKKVDEWIKKKEEGEKKDGRRKTRKNRK
jgi:hypothetical protein